jgi:phytanoyl-CoA hydroxylase
VWKDQIAKTDPTNTVAMRNVRERPFLSGYHALSDVGKRFLRSAPLTDLARQFIGPDIDVPNNQVVIKPPMKSWNNTFAWHQDDHYIKDSPDWNVDIVSDLHRCYQGWLALTPTTIDNGTLWVLPRGHKSGFREHAWSKESGEWQISEEMPNPTRGSAAMPVELQPGQMLIFSGLLPHTSGPNTTRDQIRIVYQFTYTQVGGAKHQGVLPILREGRVCE